MQINAPTVLTTLIKGANCAPFLTVKNAKTVQALVQHAKQILFSLVLIACVKLVIMTMVRAVVWPVKLKIVLNVKT